MHFLDNLQVRTFDDENTLNCPLRDSPHHQTFEKSNFRASSEFGGGSHVMYMYVFWPPNFSSKLISMKYSSWPKANRHSYASRDYLSIKTYV